MSIGTILIVDDDRDDLQLFKEALREIGNNYILIETSNGTEALWKLQELKRQNALPCLIVLDINMPKMNGKETFDKIKSINEFSAIPVVILSTYCKDIDNGLFAGSNAQYFVKPNYFQELVHIAKRVLEHCQRETSY